MPIYLLPQQSRASRVTLPTYRDWAEQPPYPASLKRKPLYAWVASMGDVVRPSTTGAGPKRNAVNGFGHGVNLSAANTAFLGTALGTTGGTMVVVMTRTGTTLGSGIGYSAAGSTDRFSVHLPYNDNTVYFDFGGVSSPNRISVSGLSNWDGVWVFTAGASGMRIFRDGALLATSSTAVTRTSGASAFGFGAMSGTDTGAVYNALFVDNIQWSDQAALEASANPWQLFDPEPSYWSVVSPQYVLPISDGKHLSPLNVRERTEQPQHPILANGTMLPSATLLWNAAAPLHNAAGIGSGALKGNPTFGIIGDSRALVMDGTGDAVEFPGARTEASVPATYTMAAMFVCPSGSGVFVTGTSSATNGGLHLYMVSGVVHAFIAGMFDLALSLTLTVGDPYFVALTAVPFVGPNNYVGHAVNLKTGAYTTAGNTNAAVWQAGDGLFHVGGGRNWPAAMFVGPIAFAYHSDKFVADATWVKNVAKNPWKLFEQDISYFSRQQSAWKPTYGTDLFALTGEMTRSDSDYIYSAASDQHNTFSLPLGTPNTPLIDTSHRVRVATQVVEGMLQVRLKQEGKSIASWLISKYDAPTLTERVLDLSSTEAAQITDYSALRLEMESSYGLDLSFVATVSSNTATITVPAAAQVGDVAVLLDRAYGSSAPALVVPTGWISCGTGLQNSPMAMQGSYKILTASDLNSTITGMAASNATYSVKRMLIFRAMVPITSASIDGYDITSAAGVYNNTLQVSANKWPSVNFLFCGVSGGSNMTLSPPAMTPAAEYLQYGGSNSAAILYQTQAMTATNVDVTSTTNYSSQLFMSFTLRAYANG